MKIIRLGAWLVVALLLALSLFALGCGTESGSETDGAAEINDDAMMEDGEELAEEGFVEDVPTGEPFVQENFQNIKSAHYVSSDPPNNTLLSTVPAQVAINFNFTVAPPSVIHVTRDGVDVTTGPTTISPDRLALVVPINAGVTGNYGVDYTACWPDGSCHTGSFGFSVQLP